MFNDGTLDDCPVEKMLYFIGSRVEMTQYVRSACGFTEQCNVGWIATKVRDVVMDPLQESLLVSKPCDMY